MAEEDEEKTFTVDENGLRLCKECEAVVDEDGYAIHTCSYGSEECSTCGRCFCDQSC